MNKSITEKKYLIIAILGTWFMASTPATAQENVIYREKTEVDFEDESKVS